MRFVVLYTDQTMKSLEVMQEERQGERKKTKLKCELLFSSASHSDCVWNVSCFESDHNWTQPDLHDVPQSDKHQLISSCSADGTLRFWSLSSLLQNAVSSASSSVSSSPTTEVLSTIRNVLSSEGMESGAAVDLGKKANGIRSIALRPDGKVVACGDREGSHSLRPMTVRS